MVQHHAGGQAVNLQKQESEGNVRKQPPTNCLRRTRSSLVQETPLPTQLSLRPDLPALPWAPAGVWGYI